MLDPKIFFWVAASVTDAVAVNTNGIEMLLANGLSTLFIKGKPVLSIGHMGLPNNSLDCPKNSPDYAIEFLIVLY